MEEVTKIKIHGKDIICKIKKIQGKRGLTYILSYGHLRITCPPSYSIKTIIDVLEKNMSKDKIDSIYSDYLICDDYVYLLGEKRRIVVLSEGQNATSMNDIIVSKRKDVEKVIDNFRDEIFFQRVRKYEKIMNTNIVHDVKSRNFDLAYGKNYSGTKNLIVLEKRLIHFSFEIIDHTIMHEVAHDFYRDHSKKFYDFLLSYCPNYKNITKKLNYGVRK